MNFQKEVIGDAILYLGDCFEIMQSLDKVNAIITDPPYSERTHTGHTVSSKGYSGEGNDGTNRKPLGYNALSVEQVKQLSELFCQMAEGWIVWMTDHTLCPIISQNLSDKDRYVFAPLPFFAPGSRVRLSGDGPSSWTDWIMVARTKAQSKWGTLPGGYLAKTGGYDKEKMGGKPTHLMTELVRDYSRKGDVVLDPFMGSGTTGVACVNTLRKFIGIEIEQKDFDHSCRRIEKAWNKSKDGLFIYESIKTKDTPLIV